MLSPRLVSWLGMGACWIFACKLEQIDDIRWLKGRRYFQVKTSRRGVLFYIALTRCYSLAYMGG